MRMLAALERAYLAEADPLRQSGFGGGPQRWRAEREPILHAIDGDGDFLDIGCANGMLLASLSTWALERHITLTPYGVDQGSQLIALARARCPQWASHFWVGNAWSWQPPRGFRSVYTLYDVVPQAYLAAYIQRLLRRVVAPGGRLIVGAYGSRSRQTAPFPIGAFLSSNGFIVTGTTMGGHPPITAFAWVDRAP